MKLAELSRRLPHESRSGYTEGSGEAPPPVQPPGRAGGSLSWLTSGTEPEQSIRRPGAASEKLCLATTLALDAPEGYRWNGGRLICKNCGVARGYLHDPKCLTQIPRPTEAHRILHGLSAYDMDDN
jgi:hypothetical protein